MAELSAWKKKREKGKVINFRGSRDEEERLNHHLRMQPGDLRAGLRLRERGKKLATLRGRREVPWCNGRPQVKKERNRRDIRGEERRMKLRQGGGTCLSRDLSWREKEATDLANLP